MKSKIWDKRDSSDKWYKINLRRKYLPKKARVLDLFCGNGEIYKNVYKDKVTKYIGVDNKKIHNANICVLTNNLHYVSKNNINDFNVFDLDDYGSPWKLLYLILKKYQGPEAIFFITDGLKLKMNINGDITKWVSATEKIPSKFNIPGLSRWYIDIFLTMLLDIQKRFYVKIENPIYLFNKQKTVCYWYLKVIKA